MLAEASLPWLLVAINLPHSVRAKCAHNRQRGSSNWLPITRLWIKDMERGGRAQYGSAVTFILTLRASRERKGLEMWVGVWVRVWLLKDEDSLVYLRVRTFSPPWVQHPVNTIYSMLLLSVIDVSEWKKWPRKKLLKDGWSCLIP